MDSIPDSPIRQVFINQDLVTLIVSFSNATLDYAPEVKRSRLRSLTAISKNFFEAASDHLWKEVDSILPFFKLLPNINCIDGLYFLENTITIEDLSRWEIYSHRVRSLTLGQSDTSASTQVYVMLAGLQASRNISLFPLLQELHCRGKMGSEDLGAFFMVASPTLEALSFVDDESGHFPVELVAACLQHVTTAAPNIRKLILHARRNSKLSLFRFPWAVVGNFQHLKTLSLELIYLPLHIDSVQQFQYLPNLSMCLYRQTKAARMRFSVSISGTPHKDRKVELWGDFGTLMKWTANSSLTGVTDLTLQGTESSSATPSNWDQVFNYLVSEGKNLTRLCIKDADAVIELPAMNKLIALSNLRELEIDMDCRVPATTTGQADDMFDYLMLSASQKQVPLAILLFRRPLLGAPLSLKVLQHIAYHASDLCHLELAIDSSVPFRSFPSSPMTASYTPSFSSLKELQINDLRQSEFQPKQHRQIALLLDSLFPALTRLSSHYSCPTKQSWEFIGQLRSDYQQFREVRRTLTNSLHARLGRTPMVSVVGP